MQNGKQYQVSAWLRLWKSTSRSDSSNDIVSSNCVVGHVRAKITLANRITRPELYALLLTQTHVHIYYYRENISKLSVDLVSLNPI